MISCKNGSKPFVESSLEIFSTDRDFKMIIFKFSRHNPTKLSEGIEFNSLRVCLNQSKALSSKISLLQCFKIEWRRDIEIQWLWLSPLFRRFFRQSRASPEVSLKKKRMKSKNYTLIQISHWSYDWVDKHLFNLISDEVFTVENKRNRLKIQGIKVETIQLN